MLSPAILLQVSDEPANFDVYLWTKIVICVWELCLGMRSVALVSKNRI
jgi:hypothetical protein